jgi:RND family efflux transporter MFP subunit
MKRSVLTVLVLGIVVLSFAAGRLSGPDPSSEPPKGEEREILYYVDPMTPGFRSDEPGIAPCGMPLEPVYADPETVQGVSSPRLPPNVVKISPARQQIIGVKVAPVETGPVTYTLRLYGQVIPDETLTYRINASTDSWIREISDVTTGDIVQKDQVLARGLAPSYYNAQATFLVTLDNLDRINRQLGGQTRQNQADIADNQVRLAVQSLQNLGITDAQIEELANTRRAQPYLQVRAPTGGVVLERNLTLNQWFKAGELFYTIADIGRVWVYADVYEDETRHLYPGMKVKVHHEQMSKTFDATVSRVLPLFDRVSKTLRVRLDVPNQMYELRPDMFVDVEIPVTMPASLHVPTDAVIDSGKRSIVYVDLGGGVFEPREVTTGWRLGRQVQVTDGLMTGERVVASGNFLIDSESRMRVSTAGPEVQMARDPVCGMYVNAEMAEQKGWTATHGGRTYYFCMDGCRAEFEKDPQMYVAPSPDESMEHRDPAPGVGMSWLEALGGGPAVRSRRVGLAQHERSKGSVFGTALTSRGVIDWDGPEPREGAWQKGWGRFPGAKYLGLGDDPGEGPPAPQSGAQKDGSTEKGPTKPESRGSASP